MKEKRFSIMKLLIGLVITVVGGLLVLPYLWDFEGYRDRLNQAISNATGTNVVIRGKITGAFIPYPQIVAKDIYLTGEKEDGEISSSLTTVKLIKADLNVSDLLFGKTRINAVTLEEPSMDWPSFRRFYQSWTAGRKEDSKVQSAADIKNIVISKGVITSRNSGSHTVESIRNINTIITMPSALSSTFRLNGDFKLDGSYFAFDANLEPGKKGNNDSTWNFHGDGFNIKFIGDMAEEEGKTTLAGTLEGNTDDIEFLIQKYMYEREVVKKKKNKKGDKESKDKQNEDNIAGIPVIFKSSFQYTPDKINIQNFVVTSAALQGQGNIVALIHRDTPEVDVDFAFDHIDADKFILKNEKPAPKTEDVTAESFIQENRETQGLYEKISDFIGGLSGSANMLCDISVKNIAYRNDSLNNLVLNADIFSGDLFIHQLSAHMPGDTLAEVTGAVKHNKIRPKFTGEVLVSGKDLRHFLNWSGIDVSMIPEKLLKKFKFSSDVTLLSQKINLTGADFSVDNMQGSGNITIRKGVETSKINSIIKLNNIDFDQYHLNKSIADFVNKYYYGDASDPYTKNFSWLRSHTGHFATELSIDQFKLNNVVVDHFASTITLDPGAMRFKDLVVNSKPLNFSGNVKVDITGLRPILELNIIGDKLDTAAFGYKAEKIKPSNKVEWSTDPMNFFALDRFDGAIDIRLKDFKYKSIHLQKLDYLSTLTEGLMDIKKLEADVPEKGRFIANGSLYLESNSILSLSFALNNVKVEQIFGLFSDIKAFSGYLSMSGSVITNGMTEFDWIKNMHSSITIAARAVDVVKFGLHDFIEDSEDVTTMVQLNDLKKRTELRGKTQFIGIDGVLNIANGMLDFPRLEMLTSRSRGVMSGKIDLVNWLMNVIGRFSYFPLDQKKAVTVGYSIVGSAYTPEKKFDVTDFMAYKGIVVDTQKKVEDLRGRRLR